MYQLKSLAILIFLFIFVSALPNYAQQSRPIKSAFNADKGEWNIAWPGKISQYDLVYKSPPVDPMQGIPLGNGETGALFWCEESRIVIAVNKSDLWDDATFGDFRENKGSPEDLNTTLRHGYRIIIDFHYPIFSHLYLRDFTARLSLADATLGLESVTPFGNVKLKAWVDRTSGKIMMDLASELNEVSSVDVFMERFGSRTFGRWYTQINRDASIGLEGTETEAGPEGVYITQRISSGIFVCGGAVISSEGTKVETVRLHSHSAVMRLSGGKQKKAQLVFAITSPTASNGVEVLKKSFALIRTEGVEALRLNHVSNWKSVWARSFMDYGDGYLNNLWYLTIYYANASQGGKYPGRFINGLWGWDRDIQPWNYYFHQNQQELYWPLNAAGFPELIVPYLDYRFNSLPHAKSDASSLLNAKGAFISDVAERRGYNSPGEKANHTPVAEIALEFWRQYKYTGDKKFLADKAVPFIIEAARFFESLFDKQSDGLYHARSGTGYEGGILLHDGLTELVYARKLFSVALDALKEANINLEEAGKWKDIMENAAPFSYLKEDEVLINRHDSSFIINWGQFKGTPVQTNQTISAGFGIKEKKLLKTYFKIGDKDYAYYKEDDPGYLPLSKRNGLKLLDGVFPTVPASPVYPSGLVGLRQRNSELFNTLVATTLLYGTEITGWDPVPIVYARLGLGDALAADLSKYPERWQIYCNGWTHWGMEGEMNKDAEMFFRTNMVRDVDNPKSNRFPLPMWPFRHTSLEALGVLSAALNESLLQSYDGVIRIAPAIRKNGNYRFTLYAEGGFVVSSEIKEGRVQWVHVKSLRGNSLNIEFPEGVYSMLRNGKSLKKVETKKNWEIKTTVNENLLFLPAEAEKSAWVNIEESPEANEGARLHSSGKVGLGLPKMY